MLLKNSSKTFENETFDIFDVVTCDEIKGSVKFYMIDWYIQIEKRILNIMD